MSKFASGKYAKAISDRSGMEFPYNEMVKEWNGSFVHRSEFESKHPQLEPRAHYGDAQGLQNARPARTEPPVAHLLAEDSMAAGPVDSILVTVNQPAHGYSTGDRVRFRGADPHFPDYPQVARVDADNINDARGHLVTKVDDNNYTFSPNDLVEQFLTDNCVPGTTTVYVDMDGVQTEYYQKVASYLQSVGQLPLGEWYDMTPADELAAIASIPGTPGWFAALDKRAEADALVDLVIAKNGSWDVLTTDAGTTGNAAKLSWVTTNFGTPGSGVGRAPATFTAAANFNKGVYGGPNKLLIDDRTDYVNQFVNAGGKAFKYYESGGIRNFGGTGKSVGPVTLLP
jgi:hypothetical protein